MYFINAELLIMNATPDGKPGVLEKKEPGQWKLEKK
jgi:hypothetical protein